MVVEPLIVSMETARNTSKSSSLFSSQLRHSLLVAMWILFRVPTKTIPPATQAVQVELEFGDVNLCYKTCNLILNDITMVIRFVFLCSKFYGMY